MSQVAHKAGAYLGCYKMKQLGILRLPTRWDASPLQGYPKYLIHQYQFIHLGGERHYDSKVSYPKTEHRALARARTWTARRRDERTDHEATVSASPMGTGIQLIIYEAIACALF